MTRSRRLDPVDGWHHLMSRGVDRNIIFFDDVDRVEFGRLLGDACRRFSVEVHAYCLMDNHFHLLVRCPGGGVSDFMRILCGLFARFVNDRIGRVGHLFGARFTSRLLTTHVYVANVGRYIHRNPLDVVGVDSVSDYRWSSHRTYLGCRQAPEWLHTSPLLDWFGGPHGFEGFVTDSATGSLAGMAAGEVVHLVTAIDSAIDEHSSRAGRSILAQRRAIALTIDDLSEDAKTALVDQIGIETSGARRAAERRARLLVADDPEIVLLRSRAIDLVAPGPYTDRRVA